MGLVIHPPAGPPKGIAHTQGAKGAAEEAATGDIFAALLAELFAPAESESEAAATEAPLPEAKPKDEAEGDGASASLMAAMAAISANLAPTTPVPSTGEVQATAGGAAIAAVAGTSQPPAEAELPAEGVATEMAADGAETETAAPVTQAAEGAPDSAIDAPEAASAALEPITTAAEPETDSAPDDASAEAGEAPPTEQPLESVVRSAGNAEEQPAGDNNDARPGRQEAKPQASASAQGIVPAAEHSAAGQLRTAAVDQSASTNATNAPPPQPASAPPAVEQVARTVIERAEAGGGEARIHLSPAELGDVVIRVHTEGDAVRVEVRADRPEAMHLLRDSTTDLSALLGSRGLNLSGVHVGLGGQGSRGSHGYEPERLFNNRPGRGDFASLMGIGDASATVLHNRVRTAYNPDGAHVYRI